MKMKERKITQNVTASRRLNCSGKPKNFTLGQCTMLRNHIPTPCINFKVSWYGSEFNSINIYSKKVFKRNFTLF